MGSSAQISWTRCLPCLTDASWRVEILLDPLGNPRSSRVADKHQVPCGVREVVLAQPKIRLALSTQAFAWGLRIVCAIKAEIFLTSGL